LKPGPNVRQHARAGSFWLARVREADYASFGSGRLNNL